MTRYRQCADAERQPNVKILHLPLLKLTRFLTQGDPTVPNWGGPASNSSKKTPQEVGTRAKMATYAEGRQLCGIIRGGVEHTTDYN